MEQSPSWTADFFTYSRNPPRDTEPDGSLPSSQQPTQLLPALSHINPVCAFSPILPTMSQINPVHTFPSYPCKTHFNIILSPTPRHFKYSLSFRFRNKTSAYIFVLHTCCVPCPSHPQPGHHIYLNINQHDALNFIMSLFHASACFEHHVLIIRRPKLYYTVSGIITPIGGCPVRPPIGVMIPETV